MLGCEVSVCKMFTKKEIDEFLEKISGMKNNRNICSRKFVALILLLLVAIDKTQNGVSPVPCDWINWHITDVDFMKNVKENLHSISDLFLDVPTEYYANYLLEKERHKILDHHYWNDCDVHWSYYRGKGLLKGWYCDTPGEDILIKLLAVADYGY